MSKGKLIVLEGLDGSGKGTQAKLLAKHLTVTDRLVERSPSRIMTVIPVRWSRCIWPGSLATSLTMSTPTRHPAFMLWTAMRGISRTGASSTRKAAS